MAKVRTEGARWSSRVVPVESIRPNAWNPNRQSKRVFATLLRSIEKHGQHLRPIVVRSISDDVEAFEIIDGFHRWRAVRELGFTHIDAIVTEADDRTARKLTIALNEIEGDPDQGLLAELLAGLAKDGGVDDLLTELPYNGVEMRLLLDFAANAWDLDQKPAPAPPPDESAVNAADLETLTLAVTPAQRATLEKAARAALGPDAPKLPRDILLAAGLERVAAAWLAKT